MSKKPDKEHHGLIYAVLAATLTAIIAIIIRWTESVPIVTILFFRFFICFLCVIPFLWNRKVIVTETSIRKHSFRALLGLLSMGCYFYSITHLSVMNAITLANTAPLFLPIVIFFWARKILPIPRFIALGIGFLGVVVVLRPSPDIEIGAALIGLLGGLCAAFVQVGIRKLSQTESTTTILTHYFLISTVVAFFPMIYFWQPIKPIELWLNLALMGIGSFLFQYCFTRSLKSASASKISAVNYLGVPFGGILGWWAFREEPSLWTIVGTGLIICGGIIAILSKQEARHRTPRD